ncbi:hypothetical protein BH23PLA1_BH23PLA1_31190 [soil metagenome]
MKDKFIMIKKNQIFFSYSLSLIFSLSSLCALCGETVFIPEDNPSQIEITGRMDSPALREPSGIVKSRRSPGIYWVHNDSGNAPMLFAIRADGSLVQAFMTSVVNVDWEDIATDADGRLYIGDIGDNFGLLPVRVIYRLDEPDPEQPAEGALSVPLASYYRFRDGDRFDAEGLVIQGSRALVIAKRLDGREAEVYAVPIDPPAPLIRPALPEQVATLPGFQEPVTGADLSSDGRLLVACGLDVVRVYEIREERPWRLVGEVRYKVNDQIEAVCWDGADLRLCGEKGGMYRIPLEAWRDRTAEGPGP